MPRRRNRRSKKRDDQEEEPLITLPTIPNGVRRQLESTWERYESIQNLKSEETTEELHANGHTDPAVEWVVTEKIHGANFGLLTNGKHVIATKRTSLLQDYSPFFRGWQEVVVQHYRQALKVMHHIKSNIKPDAQVVTIFGELFGGYYEHPEIEVPEAVGQIQFGLSYSPTLHFCAFDIQVDGTFLDYNVAHTVCATVRLMFAEPIIRGTFDECIEFDVENFETLVPARLNLPPPVTRHGQPNIGEGVVIRRAEGAHVMIKKKAEKFFEFSAKNGIETAAKKRKMIKLMGKNSFDFAISCLTESRFDAALSKIGEVNDENARDILSEFVSDVWREVTREMPTVRRLQSTQRAMVKSYLSEIAEKYGKRCVAKRRRQLRECAESGDVESDAKEC